MSNCFERAAMGLKHYAAFATGPRLRLAARREQSKYQIVATLHLHVLNHIARIRIHGCVAANNRPPLLSHKKEPTPGVAVGLKLASGVNWPREKRTRPFAAMAQLELNIHAHKHAGAGVVIGRQVTIVEAAHVVAQS